MTESDRIVAAVTCAVGLAEGPRGVRAVLTALARLEPVSTRVLARAVDLPVPIVAAICGELRRCGVVADERPTQLTIAGRRRFAHAGSLDLDTTCAACGGRGIALPENVVHLRRGLAHVAESAPDARTELDQCHCTPKTMLRRVLALHAAGAIVGRRILLLGDDDLISLALARFVARFGSGDVIEELTVLDVDERLLAFVAGELDDAPFPCSFVHADLRDPLLSEHAGHYDTVVTDPPYTEEGARLFLSRATEALAGEGSTVFLSFGSRRPGAQLALQRTIIESGLEIRALTRDFNDYVGAGVLGGTSHLYQLRATANVVPPVRGRFTGELYTAARRRTDATPSTSRRPERRSGAAR
ncbi:MAG TPA: bis-aminopropyl spermidine synthase family protein [Gaiellaceae bacterium]|nr:bis-aminopropyl spermidine synthase family protein [Gaiellaceae bacterium]